MKKREERLFHLSIIDIIRIDRAIDNAEPNEALRIIGKGYIKERTKK